MQAGVSKSPAVGAPRGEIKQLCSINQNVLIEKSDPRKPRARRAGHCWGWRKLTLFWCELCKDLLAWMIFYYYYYFIDYQELCWRSKSCCVCPTGWISSLFKGRRSYFPFSPTLFASRCALERLSPHNFSLGLRGIFLLLLGPFFSSPCTHLG